MKERCANHPEKEALSVCHSCNRYYCNECLVEGVSYDYCMLPECQDRLRQEELPAVFACPTCNTLLELTRKERMAKRFICPHCNKLAVFDHPDVGEPVVPET